MIRGEYARRCTSNSRPPEISSEECASASELRLRFGRARTFRILRALRGIAPAIARSDSRGLPILMRLSLPPSRSGLPPCLRKFCVSTCLALVGAMRRSWWSWWHARPRAQAFAPRRTRGQTHNLCQALGLRPQCPSLTRAPSPPPSSPPHPTTHTSSRSQLNGERRFCNRRAGRSIFFDCASDSRPGDHPNASFQALLR